MLFCPWCGNLLVVAHHEVSSYCCTACPYHQKLIGGMKVEKTVVLEAKKVDDVLGGADAWKNVDQTDARCSECHNGRAYYMQIQIRSADEPSTTFYKCTKCGHRWNEN